MSTTAHFSITQYDRIVNTGALDGRRLELVEGEIREMSPIGPIHEDIVDLLAEWSFAEANDVRVRIQQSIELSTHDSAPEPDIVWVTRRSYRTERPAAGDVLLLIEVADSSVQYDLGQKAGFYASAAITDYWVVDVLAQEVVVHRKPIDGVYGDVTRFGSDLSISPLLRPDAVLTMSTLFPPQSDC